MTAKEIMSKTKGAAKANTAPAAFTDDGFAMGKTSEIDKKIARSFFSKSKAVGSQRLMSRWKYLKYQFSYDH